MLMGKMSEKNTELRIAASVHIHRNMLWCVAGLPEEVTLQLKNET